LNPSDFASKVSIPNPNKAMKPNQANVYEQAKRLKSKSYMALKDNHFADLF